MTTLWIYSFFFLFSFWNKSVLSSKNKAVYGMVDRSCHNHSGLLLYVAPKRDEMLPGLDNSAESHPAPTPAKVDFLQNKQVHFVAQDIICYRNP